MEPGSVIDFLGPQLGAVHGRFHGLEVHVNTDFTPVVRHQFADVLHFWQARAGIGKLGDFEAVGEARLGQQSPGLVGIVTVVRLEGIQPGRLPAGEFGVGVSLHHQLGAALKEHLVDFRPVNSPVHGLPHQSHRHRLGGVIVGIIGQVIAAEETNQADGGGSALDDLHAAGQSADLQITGNLRRLDLLGHQHSQLGRRLGDEENLQFREVGSLAPMGKRGGLIAEVLGFGVLGELVRAGTDGVVGHQPDTLIVGVETVHDTTVIVPVILAADDGSVVGAHIGSHNGFGLIQVELHHVAIGAVGHHDLFEQVAPGSGAAVEVVIAALLPHSVLDILGGQLAPVLVELDTLLELESPDGEVVIGRPLGRKHGNRIGVLVELDQALEHGQDDGQVAAAGNGIGQVTSGGAAGDLKFDHGGFGHSHGIRGGSRGGNRSRGRGLGFRADCALPNHGADGGLRYWFCRRSGLGWLGRGGGFRYRGSRSGFRLGRRGGLGRSGTAAGRLGRGRLRGRCATCNQRQ